MRSVLELRPYYRQVAGALALGSVGGLLMNTAVVLPALLLGRAIDSVSSFARGIASVDDVFVAVLLLVGGTLATEGPRVAKRWFLSTARLRILANLRVDAARGVLAWPMARLMATSVGSLMSRIGGDLEVLGKGIQELVTETWDTLVAFTSLVVAMALVDVRLSASSLPPVVVAMLVAYGAGRLVRTRTLAARAAGAGLVAAIHERLTAVRLLRVLGRSGAAAAAVERRSREQADANLAAVRLRVALQPLYATLMSAGVIVVVWRGGHDVVDGAVSLGSFVGFLELYRRFVDRAHGIPQMLNALQAGGAAYERVQPLLAPPLHGDEPRWSSFRAAHVAGAGADAAPPPDADAHAGAAAVSVRDAVVAYGSSGVRALDGVSVEIPAGSMLAVTGPVGAGKSAFARACVGLTPLERGSVVVDDVGRARVAWVPEDPQLFSGTIEENIRMGGSSGAHVDAAVDAAALDLAAFPAGLSTPVGELGVRVSGGQRQRIALARAIAACAPRWPALLVLDDPFSSVDVETERAIVARLRALFGADAPPDRRATIVLISHRLAAFTLADRVLVLDRGIVAEQGTHASLVDAGGLYARIWRAQRRTS